MYCYLFFNYVWSSTHSRSHCPPPLVLESTKKFPSVLSQIPTRNWLEFTTKIHSLFSCLIFIGFLGYITFIILSWDCRYIWIALLLFCRWFSEYIVPQHYSLLPHHVPFSSIFCSREFLFLWGYSCSVLASLFVDLVSFSFVTPFFAPTFYSFLLHLSFQRVSCSMWPFM